MMHLLCHPVENAASHWTISEVIHGSVLYLLNVATYQEWRYQRTKDPFLDRKLISHYR